MLAIEFHTVAVPWGQCITVELGPIEASSLAVLRANGFDDAPVTSRENVLGIVSVERLDALHSSGDTLALEHVDADESRFLGVNGTEIDAIGMLHALAVTRSVILRRAQATDVEPVGFVTISDLNRQAVRAVIYEVLAGLETDLAFVVQHLFLDPWDWVRYLNEDSQVRVLGHWDLAKRRGVDVGPITAATLTQLLQVAVKSSVVMDRLGYRRRTELERDSGRLPELRNRVMHPVRPLVLDIDDAGAMARALDSALRISHRVTEAARTLRL